MTIKDVTRKQVIELAKTMPADALALWYEYGLFVQARATGSQPHVLDDAALQEEFDLWEAASDEDWLALPGFHRHGIPDARS